MMQHYLQMKKEYPDCILFYRLGDFYEMFFEDAVFVSKTLKLTLTGKSCGLPERAPMCGVPFHAADTYIDRLVAEGCKVAVCEQLEDPKDAKGIVKRDVIRVVTPGTNTNIYDMDSGSNSFIMCIAYICDSFGIATADVTTGDLLVTQLRQGESLFDEISKFAPKEIICNQSFFMSGVDVKSIKERFDVPVNSLNDHSFEENSAKERLMRHFKVSNIEGLGLADIPSALIASGALLYYLTDTQKSDPENITEISVYNGESFMTIDSSSRRNLELTETMREKEKRGSLFWVIDKTKTAMGSRMLKSFLAQPLIDARAIEERLDAVSELSEKLMDRDEIREYLNAIYDIERLMCRVSYGNANPRDIIALKGSLSMLGPIKKVLSGFDSALLKRLNERIDDFEELVALIERAVVDEPPMAVKEGGIIKQGYSSEADTLRSAKTEGKEWLLNLENEQRERTGIKNLRIRFNKVFGYYFEVTNSFLDLVPEDFIRKQTLTNAERFTTQELKKIEDMILNSEERLNSLEYELFDDVRRTISENVSKIKESAKAVSYLDAFCSLSYVAEHEGYVRPAINTKGIINIKDGRHPVVEKMIPPGSFVSNDVFLDSENNRILIITGPNMAGKSTYMRFTALIVLLASIGSFVPAKSADVCVTDRIFTRVGASDDLASGQSTFMVEMTEVANILRNATKNSLLILDEIGRGTSTYDGLAIAWAVVEHISNVKLCGGKALFATHYHELTTLEGKIPCVNNYCFAVKERGDEVVFLRKITKGGADRSYGIEVAKLAGVPSSVIERARVIVDELSDNDITQRIERVGAPPIREASGKKKKDNGLENQMTLFDFMGYDLVIDEIKKLDLSNMTPMEAMNTLYKLQSEVNDRNERKDSPS
ncbi:MAG: DNA mismatch repair protein MutS [Lachnospiraceae bacterium]|nr:DNA mismatch repair protein MutS [Lachnospiraceae bacterium]